MSSFHPIAPALLLLPVAVLALSLPTLAQPAMPHRVATDAGGGNLPGVSGFELFRNGIYWWKSGAQNSEVARREGTLVVNAALGIRAPIEWVAPASRYLGRGYDFSIDGAVRDDLFIHYAANGLLRRKPIASDFTDALADSTRFLVDRFSGNPPQFSRVPVAANGAVLLWRGDLWSSHAANGQFTIHRPGPLTSFVSFSAAGGPVKRMAVVEVLQNNGSRLKDSLLVLTQDRLLYLFDLDPFNGTPHLLARNVWDFGVRNESTLGGGGLIIARNHTTAIYAATGDLSSSRINGRLLRFSARDRTFTVAYNTQSPNLQVRGVAVTADRLYLTVTPLDCGGGFGCRYRDHDAQILSRHAPAHSDFVSGSFGTIADRLTAGGSLEGFHLRSDRRWLYWTTGDDIWRIPADAQPIERDFEVLGLEVVQTTQDLDNSTRLVANRPTVVRAYARLARDTTGVGRYAVNGQLRVFLDGQPLPGSPLSPINQPTIGATGNLATLRSGADNGFLFELPAHWVQRGRLRVEFTVNPGMGIPETGPNPLGNNTVPSADIEVLQSGSPCLVFVPVHTAAPNYDPRDPASGFGAILARAHSLLPVDRFRFALKGDRISRPVVRIKSGPLGLPYPAIDYEPFDVSGGYEDVMTWLSLYSAFERDPRDCGDTHYVGTVHWLANTTSAAGSVALGLANRPDTGVGVDLVVKMEPPGVIPGVPPWGDPRGGETLAHELGHNYTLRHIDQTLSPLGCDGGRPLRAGAYPLDACTIGIVNAATLTSELADRTTQYGFDPLTGNVIGPTNAADLMSYRSSTWLSKPTFDTLLGRIPGVRGAAAPHLANARIEPLPETVVLVHGTLDLLLNTAVFRPCYRLPTATFDPAKVASSLHPPPVAHDWRLLWVDAGGTPLGEFPLLWERAEDGDPNRAVWTQFLPDRPGAAHLEIRRGGVLVAECRPSGASPSVKLRPPSLDAATHRLTVEWQGFDPDGDPLVYAIQFSADDGAAWQTLQVGYPYESFATDTRLLPGGHACRLRVVASDGFHAGWTESEPFSLPRHAPVVVLNGIQDGERFPFGAVPRLTAVAYDAEDGSLDPARLHWQLDGPQARTEIGTAVALRDLPPGPYVIQVTAVDADGQAGQASVFFEIEPIIIPATAAPVLDGDCGDPAYADAPLVRLALANGGYVNGRMIQADGALHACVSDLRFGVSSAAPASVGLRVDRRANREAPPEPADLPGFFVDEYGTPFVRHGDAMATPETGFVGVVVRGESRWSAELRIPNALLGGWNRETSVLLIHAGSSDPVADRTWPPDARGDRPERWSPASLGPRATPANRSPVAVARGPSMGVPIAGARVHLDGTGSFDPDGDPIAYEWTQVAGPTVALDGSSTAAPSFVAPDLPGETAFRFRLVVRDATLASEPAEATVVSVPVVAAPAPVPAGGSNAAGLPGEGTPFTLLWPGAPGDRCAIQASHNLIDWEASGFATVDYLGRIRFFVAAADRSGHRFYRAVAAPLPIPTDPLGALAFNGVDGFVEVAHRAELNAYPLTLAAWVRTSRNEPMVDGIVGKYADGSLNGYALFLHAGRLRAFYFGPQGGRIWDGGLGLDGGPVADGEWHHVALVVDAAGGRLIVDGTQTASLPWTGTPGPPTTTAPLRMGRYHTYPNALLGHLDEVVLWNVPRTAADLDALRHLRLSADAPPQPLALWHFDEGEGLSTVDATPNGFLGLLRGGVEWIRSEVPLGSGSDWPTGGGSW
ncbi:MAG: LamG domain-containing protein [Verrucomicrobiae bacterium]|nr:LamG domain-containing protein [Verrucomicrobiae bacterium]